MIKAGGVAIAISVTNPSPLRSRDLRTDLYGDDLTEACFEDQSAYDDFMRAVQVPMVRKLIDGDEDRFADRSRSRMIRVDTYQV